MSDEPLVSSETLTEAEKQEVREILGYGSNPGDSKHNVHTFLHNVVTAKDTTKLGVLKDEELGYMSHPVRAFKFLESFAKDIMNKPELADYFKSQSEIATSTSLSRDGTLVKLAVVQHKKIEDVTKNRKPSSSWFKKKDSNKEEATE